MRDNEQESHPFFMFLPLQSMHSPYPDIPQHKEWCTHHVDNTVWEIPKSLDLDHRDTTIKYCTLLVLTDDVIGEIISSLHKNELYSNTLIVFTTDNGLLIYSQCTSTYLMRTVCIFFSCVFM